MDLFRRFGFGVDKRRNEGFLQLLLMFRSLMSLFLAQLGMYVFWKQILLSENIAPAQLLAMLSPAINASYTTLTFYFTSSPFKRKTTFPPLHFNAVAAVAHDDNTNDNEDEEQHAMFGAAGSESRVVNIQYYHQGSDTEERSK